MTDGLNPRPKHKQHTRGEVAESRKPARVLLPFTWRSVDARRKCSRQTGGCLFDIAMLIPWSVASAVTAVYADRQSSRVRPSKSLGLLLRTDCPGTVFGVSGEFRYSWVFRYEFRLHARAPMPDHAHSHASLQVGVAAFNFLLRGLACVA